MKSSRTRAKVAIPALGIILSSFCVGFSGYSIARSSGSQANVDATALFAKKCSTCHGKDGQAKTFKAKFNHARNLTGAKWQSEVSDERIFNSISNGKGKMPAWGKKFSEAQINALVSFVRTLKQ